MSLSTPAPNTEDSAATVESDQSTSGSSTGLTLEQLRSVPIITDHACERWGERTPDASRSLANAWVHGVDVEHVTTWFEDEDGRLADEVRLYHGRIRAEDCEGESTGDVSEGSVEYSVLLMRRDDVVTTVYPLSFVSDPPIRSYLEVMNDRSVFYE